MMTMLRRILQSPALPWILPLAAGLLLMAIPEKPARACWNSVLQECFNQVPGANGYVWPFQSPNLSGRYWRRNPNYPPYVTWGHQTDIYSTVMCPNDQKALWCIGGPPNYDPEFNRYPSNYNAYVIYGPFSLAQAVEAQVSFYLFDRTEAGQDCVFWGASTSLTLNSSTMYYGGSHTGFMQYSWENRVMDLSNLRRMDNWDSVSMLGQPAVYAWWWFRSNTNSIVDLGAFLDNVAIAWDDGGMDVAAWAITLLRSNGTLVLEPQLGDSLMARCEWGTCNGGLDAYPDFRVRVRVDSTTIYDTLVTRAWPGMSVSFYTPSWVVENSDTIWLTVDYLDSVAETNEANNTRWVSYAILPPNPPPVFTWITPSTDTLWADSVAVLRWICTDSDEVAQIRLYNDVDTTGCSGIPLPGGQRTENDGPDSLVWNTTSLLHGRICHIVAVVQDEANYVCRYAPYPVVIWHGTGAADPHATVPAEFFLDQNYPNPFNPTTQLRYGVAQAGQVSLRVFDLLGRMVAEPVHGDHTPGVYSVTFDGAGLPAGLYFYSLTTPEGSLSRKMMLLK